MIEDAIVVRPESDILSAQCRWTEALVQMLLIGALWYRIMLDHICVSTPGRCEYINIGK